MVRFFFRFCTHLTQHTHPHTMRQMANASARATRTIESVSTSLSLSSRNRKSKGPGAGVVEMGSGLNVVVPAINCLKILICGGVVVVVGIFAVLDRNLVVDENDVEASVLDDANFMVDVTTSIFSVLVV